MTDIITKYFPDITDKQKEQFEKLDSLYRDWNAKINVISRKDIDNLYEHHILHSLAIAKVITFKPKTKVLDFGTGGGFPGIPLAIMFPDVTFKLIDGTGKKILVATEVAKAIGLKNVEAVHLRGEDEKGQYDFIVSRAVMPLPDLFKIINKNFSHAGHNEKANGLICLKGGNLEEELKKYKNKAVITDISTLFDEPWFKEDKKIIYVPC
nr:16S rRNA (guanine(527)-N(7))-methyltransferase RsmG [Prevotella sp.]